MAEFSEVGRGAIPLSSSTSFNQKAKGDVKMLKEEMRYGRLILNNKPYIMDNKNGKPCLKEDKEFNKLTKLSEQISKKLAPQLNAEAVIQEAVMGLLPKDVKKLYGMLFKSKKKYKPKTRKHHCVDMKIGNFVLPISDN